MEFKQVIKRKLSNNNLEFNKEIEETKTRETILKSEITSRITYCSNEEIKLLSDKLSQILSLKKDAQKEQNKENKHFKENITYQILGVSEYLALNNEKGSNAKIILNVDDKSIIIVQNDVKAGTPADILMKRNNIKLLYNKENAEFIKGLFSEKVKDEIIIKRLAKSILFELLVFLKQNFRNKHDTNTPNLGKQVRLLGIFLTKKKNAGKSD